MHKHRVGDPVQYYECDGTDPAPGQILRVHDDGSCVCLVAWCSVAKTYKEFLNVPHAEPTTDSGPFWLCPTEDGTVSE